MKNPIKTKEKNPCYRCGKMGHGPGTCGFREAKCSNCGNSTMSRASVTARKSNQEDKTTRAHLVGQRNGWAQTLLHCSHGRGCNMASGSYSFNPLPSSSGGEWTPPHYGDTFICRHWSSHKFDLQNNPKESIPCSCLFGHVPADFAHIYCGGHPCPRTNVGTSEVRGVHGSPQVACSQRQRGTPAQM